MSKAKHEIHEKLLSCITYTPWKLKLVNFSDQVYLVIGFQIINGLFEQDIPVFFADKLKHV